MTLNGRIARSLCIAELPVKPADCHSRCDACIVLFVGNYMQMMIVLKPIAFDVVIYMTQLFDYYLYSVDILSL